MWQGPARSRCPIPDGVGADHRGEEIKLRLERFDLEKGSTTGSLLVDGEFACFTLEDEVRPIKIQHETAIPEGIYQVTLTWSPKFKRRLPLIIGVPNFDGIRIHTGNDVNDTSGCILVGEQITTAVGMPFLLHSKSAFDRLYDRLLQAELRGESISIEVAHGNGQGIPAGS